MSTSNGDKKRKSSEPAPENPSVTKQPKLEESNMSAPGNPASFNNTMHQIQALLNSQQLPDEQKRKYLTGMETLRRMFDENGSGSTQAHQAQLKAEQILGHFRQASQRQREQQRVQAQQMQQTNSMQGGQGIPLGSGVQNGGVAVLAHPGIAPGSGAAQAPTAASILQKVSSWIVPPGVQPEGADRWRADISSRLNAVASKMQQAKYTINRCHNTINQPNCTPEQHKEANENLKEATANFSQCKEIINKFAQQQKTLVAQQQAIRLSQQQQQQQPPPPQKIQPQQDTTAQGPMGSGIIMQKPAAAVAPSVQHPQQQQQQQQQMQQQHQQIQPHLQGKVAQTATSNAQPPQNIHPQPQPIQPSSQMQQPQPTQQMTTSALAGSRIATSSRADSPPGVTTVNSQINAMNQSRPNAGNPNVRPSMSPAAQPASIQHQQLSQQLPQQQSQQPHLQQAIPQQAQQAPQVVQGPRPAPQVPQAVQQSGQVRPSPAPMVGTPANAQPNSPVPRPGSAQVPTRPPTAGAPVPPQQRIQAASTASPTPAQPPPPTRENTAHRMPISKTLSVPQPQPVQMPSPRPTLTGGANPPANQVMNSPAIPKPPAFEFDEGGMGLLSKRKLEELVKQIDPDEKLDPDVEELVLEFVDEFIDKITTTACKMAKLRGSDTLEIKDIQIILERNWNIRIPGYSADEIRTVRKFNPAPAYHQKMGALATHKQLAQSSGKGGD
ncbi:Transcription initiation factor TFIID subunit 12 [Rhizina undulata]